MKSIFQAINNFLVDGSNDPVIMATGFKQEAPSLDARRAEVKRKMNQNGRKSLIEGGHFSHHNKVLARNEQMKMF